MTAKAPAVWVSWHSTVVPSSVCVLPVLPCCQVLAIAGTVMFAAAATSSGLLHVWRSGGNMLLPPLVLGSPPVRMEAQGNWGLQVLGADGHLLLLDLQRVGPHSMFQQK